MDERLRGMLEAYKSIYGRWQRTGKQYPKLLKRAAKLCKEIEHYAQQLNQQQGHQLWDELQRQLHIKNPWSLFRRLLAPEDTKVEKRKLLTKIVRDHDGDMKSIFGNSRKYTLTPHKDASSSTPVKETSDLTLPSWSMRRKKP